MAEQAIAATTESRSFTEKALDVVDRAKGPAMGAAIMFAAHRVMAPQSTFEDSLIFSTVGAAGLPVLAEHIKEKFGELKTAVIENLPSTRFHRVEEKVEMVSAEAEKNLYTARATALLLAQKTGMSLRQIDEAVQGVVDKNTSEQIYQRLKGINTGGKQKPGNMERAVEKGLNKHQGRK